MWVFVFPLRCHTLPVIVNEKKGLVRFPACRHSILRFSSAIVFSRQGITDMKRFLTSDPSNSGGLGNR
jgi:hypothetical protein